MRLKLTLLITTLLSLGLVSCIDNRDCVTCGADTVILDEVPATPQGVHSASQDQGTLVFWNGIYEHDVVEYVIYRSFDPVSGYRAVGSMRARPNPNLDLLLYTYYDDGLANGTTYWYAVASVDSAGQVSDLSAEDVNDTPRPDGNDVLMPNDIDWTIAGFDFSSGRRLEDISAFADIWVDRTVDIVGNDTTVIAYINVADIATDIQDMGYQSSFDDISVAPANGWSELGWVEVILGHTYIIWTADNNFAKLQVNGIGSFGNFGFRWAYQTDPGNLELAPSLITKPVHGPDYLKARRNEAQTETR